MRCQPTRIRNFALTGLPILTVLLTTSVSQAATISTSFLTSSTGTTLIAFSDTIQFEVGPAPPGAGGGGGPRSWTPSMPAAVTRSLVSSSPKSAHSSPRRLPFSRWPYARPRRPRAAWWYSARSSSSKSGESGTGRSTAP